MIDWVGIKGNWDINENKISQKEIKRVATCCSTENKFQSDSYQLTGEIIISEIDLHEFYDNNRNFVTKMPQGEAKIFFNKAKEIKQSKLTEKFRIDFLKRGAESFCRLIISSTNIIFPLEITENEPLKFKFLLKTIHLTEGKQVIISLMVNNHWLFEKIPINKDFDGYVGVGAYNAKVTFSDINLIEFPKKKCFVIMQYDNQRDYIFENAIEKSITEIENATNYQFNKAIRLDKKYLTGLIPLQLQKKLKDADIIIADISEPNLNAFYEIGFVEALNKIVIKIRDTKARFKMPSDIISHRYFEYNLPVKQSKLDKEAINLKDKLKEVIINELTK